MFHTNLTCAIYPGEVRNYLHEDCPHKALLLEEPEDQWLKPREDTCLYSTCFSRVNILSTVATNDIQTYLNPYFLLKIWNS